MACGTHSVNDSTAVYAAGRPGHQYHARCLPLLRYTSLASLRAIVVIVICYGYGYGYGYGYILGPSPVPPIYLAGSFGLVRPAWVRYTRSAVPQNVEGLTRPPRSAPAPPIPFTLAAHREGLHKPTATLHLCEPYTQIYLYLTPTQTYLYITTTQTYLYLTPTLHLHKPTSTLDQHKPTSTLQLHKPTSTNLTHKSTSTLHLREPTFTLQLHKPPSTLHLPHTYTSLPLPYTCLTPTHSAAVLTLQRCYNGPL